MRLPIMLSGIVVLVLAVSACADTTSGADNPVAPAVIDRGQELYEATCASCHGSDLRGTERGPSHLSIVYEPSHHADVAFLLAVRNGARAHHWSFGDMPPVEGLSDDDVAAITAYVRSVQESEGFESYPP